MSKAQQEEIKNNINDFLNSPVEQQLDSQNQLFFNKEEPMEVVQSEEIIKIFKDDVSSEWSRNSEPERPKQQIELSLCGHLVQDDNVQ